MATLITLGASARGKTEKTGSSSAVQMALLAPRLVPCIAPARLARRARLVAGCAVNVVAPSPASAPVATSLAPATTPRVSRPGIRSPNGRAARAVACGGGAHALFDVAAGAFRVSSLAHNSAALACAVALAILVVQALDDTGASAGNDKRNASLLLLSAAIVAPPAVTAWWLTSAGRSVAFGALALRTFLLNGSLSLFGALSTAVDAVATFGLLVITATPWANAWRCTRTAAVVNAAVCAYMLFSHMRGGGDFATASQGKYLSAGAGLTLLATAGYVVLLALAVASTGARW